MEGSHGCLKHKSILWDMRNIWRKSGRRQDGLESTRFIEGLAFPPLSVVYESHEEVFYIVNLGS